MLLKRKVFMGTRRSGEQNVRNITKNSTGTYQVSLPIDLVRTLGWKQGQKVVFKKRGKDLVIVDWQE
ncbi:AbrB/MazE/SpoVT family DNA-binding domain-containing protein [Candidatus Nomurabacteria bacterium]|nr:AbrB/MazE/SpoVT family DNA-binding domain-containing protein [Candidatus Nomurabacteria bacterium]